MSSEGSGKSAHFCRLDEPSLLENVISTKISLAGFNMTCDFQQCGILTSVDSDEPVQHPFKLINSK